MSEISAIKKVDKERQVHIELDFNPGGTTQQTLKYEFLINPESIEFNDNAKFSQERIRWDEMSDDQGSYVIQFHHNELELISIAGKSAVFYSDYGLAKNNEERSQSLGYINFQKLIATIRNNGTNRNFFDLFHRRLPAIVSVGNCILHYRKRDYHGFFTSLNVSENDSKPFNYDFSCEFKITRRF